MLPIRKLDDMTIRLISAGEVIHRPVNAVKELIENCIDAGATKIEISVLDGGMRSIVLLDNGSGIQVSDFALVCERHSTSKLKSFDELASISTYGFRGEALASISAISRFRLISKTEESTVAYTATYLNGRITSGPAPCAWNYRSGTSIEILDLFYTLPTRRQVMLQNFSAEYKKILDIVYYYSLNFMGAVEFTFRNNSTNKEFCGCSEEQVLKSIMGSSFLPNALLRLGDVVFSDMNFCISKAIFSSPQHSLAELTFILYVNGRLVECKEVRNAIKQLYSEIYLCKTKNPFLFLSISILNGDIDVNYHPAKKEVLLSKAADISQKIYLKLQDTIKSSNLFVTRNVPELGKEAFPATVCNSSLLHSKTPIRYRAMTDPSSQRIDTFIYREENSFRRNIFPEVAQKSGENLQLSQYETKRPPSDVSNPHYMSTQQEQEKTVEIAHAPEFKKICSVKYHKPSTDYCNNRPVDELKLKKDQFIKSISAFLQNSSSIFSERLFKTWINKTIYVGLYKEGTCFIQHELGLYEFNYQHMAIQYYQYIVATNFINTFAIKKRIVQYNIRELIANALDYLHAENSNQNLEEILGYYVKIESETILNLALLGFELDDKKENLTAIPELINHHLVPSMISLGIFLIRLADNPFLISSTSLIELLLSEISFCYSNIDHLIEPEKDKFLKHILFPTVKSHSKSFDSSVNDVKCSFTSIIKKIVDVPSLFKTFERC